MGLTLKIQLDLLRHFLRVIGVRPYPPKRNLVEGVLGDLTSGKRVITAHGCVVISSKGTLYVAREKRPTDPLLTLETGDNRTWDKRWAVDNRTSDRITVSSLGSTPLSEDTLMKDGLVLAHEGKIRELPSLVRQSLVIIKNDQNKILGIPGFIEHPHVQVAFKPRYELLSHE